MEVTEAGIGVTVRPHTWLLLRGSEGSPQVGAVAAANPVLVLSHEGIVLLTGGLGVAPHPLS